MDHNLEDSLNLESAMGSMDFDHSGVVVNQEDITLEATGHEGDIAMEFEQIEEQPILMDTGSEEIIDFIGGQFTLQGYSVQDDQINAGTSSKVESNQQTELTSQTDAMIDFQFDTDNIAQTIKQEATIQNTQPVFYAVQTAPATQSGNKKSDTAVLTSVPRQVAIAPKPANLTRIITKKSGFTTTKSFAITPRPVALVINKGTPRPMTNKPNTVLAKVGKQFVMVPAGTGQKIKLVPSSSPASGIHYVRANSDQAQLISTKSLGNAVTAKVVLQGQSSVDVSNQPAVITKLMPANTAQARYVMQQKTVPISFGGNKVILTSPTKQGVKLGKKQIIAIKTKSKLVPATTQSPGTTTKKVVITSNPSQNVILKTTAPQKASDGVAPRTQLHQINVPGKGIQYIRLITNQTPLAPKPVPKAQPAAATVPSKAFVLTDTKGNLIQMTAGKMVTSQASPLVITGKVGIPAKSNLIQMTAEKMSTSQPPPLVINGKVGIPAKVATNTQKKFVRIAPVTKKAIQPTIQPIRAAQSLLAPITSTSTSASTSTSTSTSMADETVVSLDEFNNLIDTHNLSSAPDEGGGGGGGAEGEGEGEGETDSKAALRALIEDAVAGGAGEREGEGDGEGEGEGTYTHSLQEVEVEIQGLTGQSPNEDENSSNLDLNDSSDRSVRHPLIVIPSNYSKQQQITADDDRNHRILDERKTLTALVNVEAESVPYDSQLSPSHALSDNELVSNELDLRPRKACNCTKSQCLKLYCDCFANGEFCNRCNCNNCHNNLENEELRQKAIRACLDRNPNAFRPKIGKSKSGGPEIVRRHNKGCNCKRSGCLKNYCECYEAKIACTSMCKCVGCRNIEETLERRRVAARRRDRLAGPLFRPPSLALALALPKQPCSFMTTEVIEAVCQCLLAAAAEGGEGEGEGLVTGEGEGEEETDPIGDVIEEFARCLQDIIGASQATPLSVLDEGHA